MDNDIKVSVETVGEIVSVLEFNSWVYLTLKVYGEIVKVEIPRIYCNSKRLKCKDVVKIVGNIADYEKYNGKRPSRTIYSKCVVERVLRKGEKNERLDAATNFSFLGHILFAEPNDEFYQLIFEVANDGICVARITSIYNYLEEIKGFLALSATGFNHPNDFTVRTYAQTILKMLGL